MRILLTGGLGYLGGRLAELLASAGHDLVLGTRRAALPQERRAIVRLDWSSDADLEQACRNVDAVVHLAGMSATECARDPVTAIQVYGVGTARLARAAVSQGVQRLLYVSSAHVYGAALVGDVDETTLPDPRHPYATSHRAAEDIVRNTHAAGSLRGVVARLSNAFGAPVDPKARCWSLLTNDLCRQAVSERRMVLQTAGRQRRDFVPMSEACRALSHLLTVPASALDPAVFNVGTGMASTILEMARAIGDRVHAVLGFRPELHVGQDDDAVGKDFGGLSIARLTRTGFVPRSAAGIEELDRLIAFAAREFGGRH